MQLAHSTIASDTQVLKPPARPTAAIDTTSVFGALREGLATSKEKVIGSFNDLKGRVGIFGGTFDPPHEGHMLLAQEMMRLHKLDSVVFIPAKQNPLKPSGPVASDDQRVTLTALAVRDFPGMFVSDIQHRLPSPSYTIDMIRAIQAENEERAQFFTLCAADIVENLHKWKEVTSLNRLAPFLIGTRPGATVSDASLAKLDPEVARQVKHGLTEIHATKASSTALRAALQQSAPARELQALGLDALVERYIREHGIYGPA